MRSHRDRAIWAGPSCRPLAGPLIGLLALVAAPLAADTPAAEPAPASRPAPLAQDTPLTTAHGNTFVAPVDWMVQQRDAATILFAPEGDSWIVLVDLPEAAAADADAALAAAWKLYKPEANRPPAHASDRPDADGWSRQRDYDYLTSPNERRVVAASTRFAGGVWNVALIDMALAVADKRGAQVSTIFSRLLPKGYSRESFAGRKAHRLDAARLAELRRFIEDGRRLLQVPGVAVGIVQNGKVVLAEGFGMREPGGTAPIDADTLFMVASNTKAMTTLLLARLVDAGRLGWQTPATAVLPSFRLGSPETTAQVRIEHLICACTGMPRQDLEWLFEFGEMTPDRALATLGTMQPTSAFGELFQYSNAMAAAAGFLAGHALFPDLELGAAYDRAMQEQVFDPLGMGATTFDFARAQAGNHTGPYSQTVDGQLAPATMAINYAAVALRPTGGAWSNVRDMLRYIQMELGGGRLSDGSRYVSETALLARRAPQVAMGQNASYGMGLMVDRTWGTDLVHHGGALIGYHSAMLWLPEHNVGAVVLTNSDPGRTLRSHFPRKLLEVLFDGQPLADARLAAAAKSHFETMAAARELLTIPADSQAAAALAARYAHPALGSITVRRGEAADGRTWFDFGEFASEMATSSNPDGTVSFKTLAPGISGLEFVVGTSAGKPTLTLRDAQHEYVFVGE